ncbi:UPF0389 protein CG9231 [Aricia agestis]|uniref:UPF0389 protein CG9231 n=1 Tax=Aricia agestis TaxID=91739 RepID=UPI001C208451|nr:UPF0389 protein CG9231 [Aricia agestis]XP_041971343.1 UPF0389 protein CG9231 [Aricia agestis]
MFTKMNRINLLGRNNFAVIRFMATPSGPKPVDGGSVSPRYKPTEFQKTLLVWTKKYKSKEEIPSLVSSETIDRARTEARIKFSNFLIVLTALGSFSAILLGKAAAKRGESVHKMNLDWHKQYEEDYKKKQEGEPKAA